MNFLLINCYNQYATLTSQKFSCNSNPTLNHG